MEEEKKEKTFVVKDRRLFDEAGERRQEPPARPETPQAAEKTGVTGQDPEPEPPRSPGESPGDTDHSEERQEASRPEVSFAGFVISLSTTAMYHFGDFPDPTSGKAEKNLQAAKQTIDILNMLKVKTEGNLSPEERQLMDEILYELRMRFVQEKSRGL